MNVMGRIFFLLGLLVLLESFCIPYKITHPLVTVGGGFYSAGPRHSGGIVQLEYRSEKKYYGHLRPQCTLAFPEFKSIFLGVGLGLDLYVNEYFVITPSFEPGYYFQGKGRRLGYPIEFRSAIELAYEMDNGLRLGAQVYHISNAGLGRHNPGAEALIFFLGIPLCF